MSFKTGLVLCPMAILFLIALPVAAESWIIQSLNQDIENINDNGCLQNSIQISGIERGDIFQIQQLNQDQGTFDADEINASFVMQWDGVDSQEISAADLSEVMKYISSRDDAKGIDFCRMDIHFFDCLPDEMKMDSEDGLQEIDMNSSREAIARLDLIMSRSWHDLWNAPDDGHRTLIMANGAGCSIVPGFRLVGEVEGIGSSPFFMSKPGATISLSSL